jgi:hypothetical protein
MCQLYFARISGKCALRLCLFVKNVAQALAKVLIRPSSLQARGLGYNLAALR